MPPERKTPTGTSAIIWLRTARCKVLRSASAASASDQGRVCDIRGIPIAFDGDLAVLVHEIVRGRQLVDALEDRSRRDHVLVGEELIERFDDPAPGRPRLGTAAL